MNNQPVRVEQLYNVSTSRVWRALTDNEQMKSWYFKLPDFKAEPGFEFTFMGGAEGDLQYKHICRIVEVIPEKKLSYSWRYEGHPGQSMVTFELFEGEKQTKLRVTHEGLESFSSSGPAFSRDNFSAGWTHILGTSLKDFLEPEPARA